MLSAIITLRYNIFDELLLRDTREGLNNC
jgi:hypothetical protein